MDVLSVKVFPKQLLLKELPAEFDVLCTHPMFGPESGKGSWQNLAFVFDRVRVGAERRRQERLEAFLDFWRAEGCRMVEMTCEEHDRQAASTQFITHTVGRVLGSMNIQATQINTKGFESLLTLRDNTANDSFDLYYGLFMYNPNATEELERLERAFDAVKKALFHRWVCRAAGSPAVCVERVLAGSSKLSSSLPSQAARLGAEPALLRGGREHGGSATRALNAAPRGVG